MKNKKGKLVMEFLMTYGWAILVILAAISALIYFGVFDTTNENKYNYEKCEFNIGNDYCNKLNLTYENSPFYGKFYCYGFTREDGYSSKAYYFTNDEIKQCEK